MLKPQYWLKYRKARRAVDGYPPYDLPHKGEAGEGELDEAQVRENFQYFMNVRQVRLAYFRDWMTQHFRLSLSFDGDSVIALEEWLWEYGGGVLKEQPDMHLFYGRNEPRWDGVLAGYNIAIDAAIFVGEFLIFRRPQLHWTHCSYSFVGSEQYVESRLHSPFIGGFPMKSCATDPIDQTFGIMMDGLKQAKIGEARYRPPRCGIVYACRSALHLANVPEPKGDEVFISGDYSHEPL